MKKNTKTSQQNVNIWSGRHRARVTKQFPRQYHIFSALKCVCVFRFFCVSAFSDLSSFPEFSRFSFFMPSSFQMLNFFRLSSVLFFKLSNYSNLRTSKPSGISSLSSFQAIKLSTCQSCPSFKVSSFDVSSHSFNHSNFQAFNI